MKFLFKKATLLGLLLGAIFLLPNKANACEGYSPVQFDFRSMPVVGFFPLSGNLSIKNTEFSTYIGGLSVDFFNKIQTKTFYYKEPIGNNQARLYTLCNNPENPLEPQIEESRISWLNVSAYLLGLNLAALGQDDKSNLVKYAYIRVGPHFKLKSFLNNNLSLGGQLGYAFVLSGDVSKATTTFQHGIDVSITFTWVGSPIPLIECKGDNCYQAKED